MSRQRKKKSAAAVTTTSPPQSWFNQDDEETLILFDENKDAKLQKQFRSFYTKEKGYNPPKIKTAEAIPFEVNVFFLNYKEGGVTTQEFVKFKYRIPIGAPQLYWELGRNSKEGIRFKDQLKAAIVRRQKNNLGNYVQEKEWACVNCGRRTADTGCYFLPLELSPILCGISLQSVPQCGDPICRINLQRWPEKNIEGKSEEITIEVRFMTDIKLSWRECAVCGKQDTEKSKLYQCER